MPGILYRGEPYTLGAFFGRNRGYYIPEYQRPYSWGEKNIEQLFTDLIHGSNSAKDSVVAHNLFLGIAITFDEPNLGTRPHFDSFKLINAVDNVIDGQQRISTFSVIACLLHNRFLSLHGQLSNNPSLVDIANEISDLCEEVATMYAVQVNSATPDKKPLIIKAEDDFWTKDGRDPLLHASYLTKPYQSVIACFLADFIQDPSVIPTIDSKILGAEPLQANVLKIGQFLEDIASANSFIDHNSILNSNYFLAMPFFGRTKDKLTNITINPMDDIAKTITLVAFYYYFSRNCYITVIEAPDEDIALDMFQSLNSTGLPLTSLETLKPHVVRYCNNNLHPLTNDKFSVSPSQKHFDIVEKWLDDKPLEKISSTNDFVSRVGLIFKGESIANLFAEQRNKLNGYYNNDCTSYTDKENFIVFLSHIVDYYKNIANAKPGNINVHLASILNNVAPQQSTLAADGALYITYLKSINKLMHVVLCRFYHEVLLDNSKIIDFINACKATTAFNTLWRAAFPNRGLDDAYRNLFAHSNQDNISYLRPTVGKDLLATLKKLLRSALSSKGITIASSVDTTWLQSAQLSLKYSGTDVKTICRFALLVSADTTSADSNDPGLMVSGGGFNALTYNNWIGIPISDYQTIEHVAPETPNPNSSWDPLLYDPQTKPYDFIGNLTLLSQPVNSSVSNNEWDTNNMNNLPGKLDYYTTLASISNIGAPGVPQWIVGQPTLSHLAPIVALGPTAIGSRYAKWDHAFVLKRSIRICEILWERMVPWLL